MTEPTSSGRVMDLVFRFRYGLHLLVYLVAFGISWAEAGHAGGARVWIALPMAVSAHLRIDLQTAILVVTGGAILLAIAAALLRTWAAAYLGSGTVHDSALRGGEIECSGPFRCMRNPLYVGTVLHTLALSVLMSSSSAVFCILSIVALQAALIASEERFLTANGGSSYLAYAARVPRIVPRVVPRSVLRSGGEVPAPGGKAHWAQAIAGEIYMWGAAVSFAAFGFRYDATLVLQGVLVSFGLSIAVRGLATKR